MQSISNDITELLNNMEVTPLDGNEELNNDLIESFTNLFEQLVLTNNLDALVAALEAVSMLKENSATKCAIMYIATLFMTEVVKSNLPSNT